MTALLSLWLQALIALADWQIAADSAEIVDRSREGSASDAWVAQTLQQINRRRAARQRHADALAALRQGRPTAHRHPLAG